MSNIKAAGTASEPATRTETELPFLKQQQEINESETLFREISKISAKQQEQTYSTHTDNEQEQPKDTAEISEARRRFPANRRLSSDEALRWTLELAGKDWELFLEWQPDTGLALPQQLQELSKLYLTLLEAALKYAEGENLAEQLERLDSLLAQKLNLVMDMDLEQLTFLLEKTGQGAALDNIRSSLYQQTAGQTIPLQAVHRLFSHGKPVSGRRIGFYTASPSLSKEGMVYQSSGKQNVRFQQAYHTQQTSWKEQLKQRNEIISNARKGISENTFKQENSAPCSGKELERANRFAAHIDGSGNLFKNPGISARNAEVTGLMAAVMYIKGQVYAGENRQGSSITFALENAIDKIIRPYLNQKEASKVYYHILTAYKQTQNPRKAIEDGQNYAYRQFREKQEDPVYQKSPPYSRDSGFFRSMSKNPGPESGLAMGLNILQKDWQNFLSAIGSQQHFSYLLKAESYSPWGVLAGAGTHLTGGRGNIGKILLGAAVVIVMGALAAMCVRFI